MTSTREEAAREEREIRTIVDRAHKAPIAEVVNELFDELGARNAVVIAGEHNARVVRAWAVGVGEPSPERADAMRIALACERILRRAVGPTMARAWFRGNVEALGMMPIFALADRPTAEVASTLIAAAQRFTS